MATMTAMTMSSAIDRLIERERKRQPKRMARLERPLTWAVSVTLIAEADINARRIVRGDKPKYMTSALATAIEVSSIAVWQELADPETIDTKKLPDIPDTIARRLRREALATAKLIGKTTKRRVENIFADGKSKSLSLSDIAKIIRQKLGGSAAKRRAKTIAGTETVRVANDAATHAAREAGMKYKIWTTAQDEKVRECHQAAHGQKVKLARNFTVCGDQFRFPGDMTYGPAIGNVINCRCHCVYTRR